MKLLIFAHTPPPHHGQSYMVQLMLAGFGGDCRRRAARREPDNSELPPSRTDYGIQCYHVNARLSRRLEEIGDLRIGKFFLLVGYCLQAIWCRLRYGVQTMYYIPAPGKSSALYRDWLVMTFCRPFFKRVVLHWHAAGLGKWLETCVQIRSRALTYRLLKRVDLSIVLSRYNRADAEKLFSRQITVVSNGIPDPCPEFARDVLPRRKARFAARRKLMSRQSLTRDDLQETGGDPQQVRVLYLAHCTREKGLFDSVAAVVRANQLLRERSLPLSMRLVVTGTFVVEAEKAEFDRLLAEPGVAEQIEYLGFVSGDQKRQLLLEADLFCFPTYYQNENQPVNLIEAMAFGLPMLTTRWRSIPELFPAGYPGLVEVRAPDQAAETLINLLATESGEGFRDIFQRQFTLERHLSGLAAAFQQLESPSAAAAPTRAVPAIH